jgi:hypothetical protein
VIETGYLYREQTPGIMEGIIMTITFEKKKYFTFGLMLALFSGILISGMVQIAQAEDRGSRQRQDFRPQQVRDFRQNEYRDSRYQHNRSYPARAQVVRTVPRDYRTVVHGGKRFYFSGGAWYRPQGPNFVIVAPPVGLFASFLPPYYATIWLRGVPYYYANEVYYMHRGNGYVVVEPPKEEVKQAPPPVEQMFIYPRLGQNEQQQADDRYACHRWAADQTGFDPTQPPGSAPANQRIEKRADYQRAMNACLDGRGYTMK